MSIQISVYTTMRFFTDKNAKVTVEGDNVEQALKAVIAVYPEAEKGLFDENGRLRDYFNIYVNENHIDTLEGLKTELKDGDELMFLPVISGGAGKSDTIIPPERSKEAKLDDKEITRYGKHLLLKDIGVKGQKRIKASKVLVVGAGSLGSPIILYLAAAGVGTIGVVDEHTVQLENLQSQILLGTRDLERPKTAAAKDAVKRLNPLVRFEPVAAAVTADNVEELIADYDVVVDASDNYPTRYILNDACVLQHKPLVFGAIYQYEGYVTIYAGENAPCFRCQFPAPPPQGLTPSCSENGILSSLPGVIGSIQAGEVLKLIIGGGNHLHNKMLVFDLWNNEFHKVNVEKRKSCPICGEHPSIFKVENFDYEDFCGLKAEKEAEEETQGIEPEELVNRVERGDAMTIVDVREPHERAISKFPNAKVIPIGQLARRQNELDPNIDTIFICREGKRSILAINTLKEAGYTGPMYNLKGGMEAAKNVIFAQDGAWL